MEAVTIVLNGVEVSGDAGATILDLAREAGVYIPTLCHDPNLASTGACRLCLVENERSGALHASCVTAIAPGMTINTNSPRVLEHRKKILELMLASHPDTCMVCDKGNSCQLRKLAAEMGIGLSRFQRIPQLDIIEEVNPFIERDLSKCILCGKCIRVDQELVVEGAIDYINRGAQAKAATLNDLPLEKSECTFCGSCVAVCPTGALMEKDRVYTGTASHTVKTVCPYCGCGCMLELDIKDGKLIRVRPSTSGPVNRGTACVRGCYSLDFIHSPERLLKPLVKTDGEFRESTWEEALSLVADGFTRIKEKYGADALAAYGSPRCTNEENYILQKFTRNVLGTNNIDNGSRLYNAASRIGLGATIGFAGTTGSIEALERSDVILVIGADPEISAPAVAYAIKRATRYGGAELIVVDPRRTALTPFARLWFRPKVGTDIALLNGLARVIINEKKLDVEFVTRMTDNFAGWSKSLENYTAARVEEITGIPRKDMQAAARLLAGASEAAIVYGNGITQQAGGIGAIMAIANLAMLTGNIGRRGGIFALQRENNAHGTCDMGVLPGFLPGYQSIDDAFSRTRFETRWGKPLPSSSGLSVMEMLEKAREGHVRAMLITAENPVSTLPQPSRVKETLESLEFLVVADMFMTETASLASVVLPAASFAEKDGTFTNFEGRVQQVRRAIEPLGDSLPDSEIILRLASALGSPMNYASLQEVTEEIEEMVPFYHHSTYNDADSWGVESPDATGNQPGTRRLYKGLFPSGFGRFSPVEYIPSSNGNTRDFPLTLMTGSERYHFGAGSRSSHSARLKKHSSQPSLEINPADAAELGIEGDTVVKIISANGELITKASISDTLPRGLLFIPIPFPQTPVYELFDSAIDEQSRAPALKSCAVRLERMPVNAEDESA